MASPSAPDLTLLFDGGCPLCVREVRFLQQRDRQARLAFVDIDASDYDAAAHAGISYRVAMGRIHAIDEFLEHGCTVRHDEYVIHQYTWPDFVPQLH